ncbi:MAG: RNA polymerase sigma factor [Planctomycetes bacterium]|nr:RNA polymerase sigma factor [Planctomycetota bacterium]NUQ35188.1 RNA polymerase sigma factor [Planctomycetaceae bacterium]
MSVRFDAARIVRDHYREVWGFLRLLGCDRSRADDLTQETFLAVLNKPFTEINDKATAGYLRKVARYAFLNSLRATQRAEARERAAAAEEVWGQFADGDGADGRVEALKRCLEGVEGKMRQALEMRYRDDMAASDVAAALDISESALNTSLFRTRQTLKDCVERKLDHV